MNPVVTPVKDNLVVFKLTDEDRKRLRAVKLMGGGGEPEDCHKRGLFGRHCHSPDNNPPVMLPYGGYQDDLQHLREQEAPHQARNN